VTVVAASASDSLIAILLLDIAIVAGCALAFGALARRMGQAPVIGEIAAGLVLGPSVLGLLPGNLDTLLFPEAARPYLQVLANVALVLFMFGIGFEVDVRRVRRSSRAAVLITASAVIVPVIAAAAVAPVLWAQHPPDDGITLLQFTMFLGVALSVTAFPVLGRLLADSGLFNTPLGSMALAVAALTDLLAWMALAALVATLGARSATSVALMIPLMCAIVVLLAAVRELLLRMLATPWCDRHGPAGGSLLVLVALALCAAATTRVGLHPAIGAFALGVACAPRRAARAGGAAKGSDPPEPDASERIAAAAHTLGFSGVVLVPLYFVVTGLNVDVTSLGSGGALEADGSPSCRSRTASSTTSSAWGRPSAPACSRHAAYMSTGRCCSTSPPRSRVNDGSTHPAGRTGSRTPACSSWPPRRCTEGSPARGRTGSPRSTPVIPCTVSRRPQRPRWTTCCGRPATSCASTRRTTTTPRRGNRSAPGARRRARIAAQTA
jgi:Kef-type K+ transport system membrane component KefB